jgi:Do/DeqQ family serine protease
MDSPMQTSKSQRFMFALLCAVAVGTPAVAQLPAKVGDTPVPSLAPMIKRTSPAVVNIATKGTVRESANRNPFFDDPFFRRYFDLPEQGPRERQFQSAGSGVIVDAKNGYVITNAHVVDKASEITVTLLDNRTIKAELVGADAASDVAVLKLKGNNLVEMSFADSSKTEVGDFVVAIGNPFGLQHTVTSGIVSALGRANINPDGRNDAYEDFIQTDAAINPGNSGGALVNLAGELVGINSAILSGSGGNIGIGFAIPANMAKSIMDQLIKYGSVKRGVLGVSIRTLTPDVAQSLGLANGTVGALVAEVVKGSPAEKAGIEPGDVVTAINGKSVRTDGELRNTIGLMRIGDKVDISVIRDGKPRRISAVVGDRDTATAAANSDDTSNKNDAALHRGLQGAELADADGGGVVVRAVAAGSAAAGNGLRPNDVIVAVGRTRVANVAQLRTATATMGAFAVTIKRGNTTIVGVID